MFKRLFVRRYENVKKIRINSRDLDRGHFGRPMMLLLPGGVQVFGTLREIHRNGIVFAASSDVRQLFFIFPFIIPISPFLFFIPFGFFTPFFLI
jgi:hypothetical protein